MIYLIIVCLSLVLSFVTLKILEMMHQDVKHYGFFGTFLAYSVFFCAIVLGVHLFNAFTL